ncbi:tRNA (guanosine(46)-N7)-methyltransferase TrmB [Rickettsiella grylli]|nr:tRNA (guanosine(46)-N7)-methyltransferase TrmB [Rickettsiella grylli]
MYLPLLMNESLRPIRSFVRRQKKLNKNQQIAFDAVSHQHLLSTCLDFKTLFEREAYTILEIGFGMGESLLQQVLHYPENNYLGIEVHRPGIAFMQMHIEKYKLKNIKVFYADAADVLAHFIPKHSLDKVQIFFPDPWPKTRHHKRRLIQPPFINLLREKHKLGGKLHLTTDWKNYAQHMLRVMENSHQWKNLAGKNQFMKRPTTRPLTKFEKRGQQLGHSIWDLIFLAI